MYCLCDKMINCWFPVPD